MTNVVQVQYDINPQIGYPGGLAEPERPYAFTNGIINVPSAATRKPRPGDGVFYDQSENRWAVPTSDAEARLVRGILSYRLDTVQSVLSATPAGANSNSYIEYDDNDPVRIGIFGTFFIVAGEALEYDDRLIWDRTDGKWNVVASPVVAGADLNAVIGSVNTALQSLGRVPIECVSPAEVADNGIALARIGYGRVY